MVPAAMIASSSLTVAKLFAFIFIYTPEGMFMFTVGSSSLLISKNPSCCASFSRTVVYTQVFVAPEVSVFTISLSPC